LNKADANRLHRLYPGIAGGLTQAGQNGRRQQIGNGRRAG